LYNRNKSTLVQYPGGKTGALTIPDTVTRLGDYSFYNCANITGVTIPASVTGIGEYVFIGCTNLTSVTFEGRINLSYLLNSFEGNLASRHLNGGEGTYTTTAPVGKNSVWTKVN